MAGAAQVREQVLLHVQVGHEADQAAQCGAQERRVDLAADCQQVDQADLGEVLEAQVRMHVVDWVEQDDSEEAEMVTMSCTHPLACWWQSET